jgi:DNA-binding Lrp family transcriptional regulator
VTTDRDRWDEARRAFDRLAAWHADSQDALDALEDVALLRHLLDQAELAAVRAARASGRSWTEIATRLGVTRQSAWERWRDLDEDAEPSTPGTIIGRAARDLRRRSRVTVPNVVGMSWEAAGEVLRGCSLVPIVEDEDGPPLPTSFRADWFVTDQTPESGARVPVGTTVRLWIDRRGGGAGVREPRRPRPEPRAGRAMRDEPSDEAVG